MWLETSSTNPTWPAPIMNTVNSLSKKVILVISPGRSGSHSAAFLLNAQHNAYVMHEGKHPNFFYSERILNMLRMTHVVSDKSVCNEWESHVKPHLKYLLSRPESIIGDTGMYFLSYLDDIADFISAQEKATLFILVLHRPIDSVVASYLDRIKHTDPWDNNFKPNSLVEWIASTWNPMYPKFEIQSFGNNIDDKKLRIQRYYNWFYQTVQSFEEKNKDQKNVLFYHADYNDFSHQEKTSSILSFLEIPIADQKTLYVHKNKTPWWMKV